MPNDPANDLQQEATSEKTNGVRFLIDYPVLGWKRYPYNRSQTFSHGELCIPEFAKQTIRIAYVYVRLRNRRVVSITQIEPANWKIDAKGRVDQREAWRRLVAAANFDHSARIKASAADVEAIKRCLGIALKESEPIPGGSPPPL